MKRRLPEFAVGQHFVRFWAVLAVKQDNIQVPRQSTVLESVI